MNKLNCLQRGLILLMSCALSTSVSSGLANSFKNQISEGLILWDESRRLTWNDFKSSPKLDSKYEAMTYTRIISTPLSYSYDSIVYNISCYFRTNDSWTKNNESEALLEHEQVHFDIFELAARKVRQEYSKFKLVSLEDAYAELDVIFKKYSSDYADSLEVNYDRETNHGLNTENQTKWETIISKELKELSDYSSTRVVIRK